MRALSNPMMETLGGFGVSAIVYYGGSQVISGQSTPGTFFSFMTALFLLYEPIKRINEVNLTIQEGIEREKESLPSWIRLPMFRIARDLLPWRRFSRTLCTKTSVLVMKESRF